EHEPRVLQVVGDETGRVVAIRGLDLLPAVVGPEELPLADQHLCGGVEPVILEPDEGTAEEREAVQHEPAGEDRARLAREILVAPEIELLVGPPEDAAEAEAMAGALQHGEVEVADVP